MILFLILVVWLPVRQEAFLMEPRLCRNRNSHQEYALHLLAQRSSQLPPHSHVHAVTQGLQSPFGVRKRVRAALDRAKKRRLEDVAEASYEPNPLYTANSSSYNLTTTTTITTTTTSMAQPETFINSTVLVQRVGQDSNPIPSNYPRRQQSNTQLPPPFTDYTLPVEPLPFKLPTLTQGQKTDLNRGQRIQIQENMGRQGYGYVVVDVQAPVDVVWHCLLDFYSYPQTIPTVRRVQMLTNTHLSQDYHSEAELTRDEIRHLYEDGTLATLQHGVASVTRAVFTLSKFQLKIAAIHKYRPHPLGDYMIFTLDPACTNVVLQMAKGTWHTQANPDGKGQEYTRVWLLCELRVSPLLPQFITDYAASRAMPRATTWIKPHVEAAANLWLKKNFNNTRK